MCIPSYSFRWYKSIGFIDSNYIVGECAFYRHPLESAKHGVYVFRALMFVADKSSTPSPLAEPFADDVCLF
jgi:hypothetical protein